MTILKLNSVRDCCKILLLASRFTTQVTLCISFMSEYYQEVSDSSKDLITEVEGKLLTWLTVLFEFEWRLFFMFVRRESLQHSRVVLVLILEPDVLRQT